MAWRRVVLDEAHVIRSFATLQSKAACGLNSERRWCLTGTPIQNRIGDFFALLVFLRVQPFVNHTLWNRLIMKPIKNGDSKGLIMLQTVLGAVCLRRKKTDKINGKPILPTLPKKKLFVEKVDYLPTEEALYKKLMDDGRNQVERKKAGNNQSFQFVFFLEILLRMRQTCDHAHMVPDSYFEKGGDEPNRVRLQRLLNECSEDCSLCESEGQKTIEAATRATVCCNSLYCERCLENCDTCPGCQAPLRGVLKPGKLEQQTEKKSKKSFKASGKLKFLCDKLREYEKADPTYKIIVFSQWTTFLDLIARTLNNECEDQDIRINHVRLDGSQSHAQRQKSISAFQDDPDVRCFLISLNAGGVGLNLTSGNKVILMDPWWNPATEDQAIDRVHRMGQKRDVEITRLEMRNSLEEKILELQNKKRDMTTTVLAGKFRKKSREQMKEERIEDMMKLLR
jgi:SWI/SNF-related matrix-associated actin-dependent regulator of chromatin subfamily A3